jgi:hypothetical protein
MGMYVVACGTHLLCLLPSIGTANEAVIVTVAESNWRANTRQVFVDKFHENLFVLRAFREN